MDIVYASGEAAVEDGLDDLHDAPSYSAVRALLRILEEKGHLTHRQDGVRFLYSPVRPRDEAGRTALRRVLETFFDGSVEQTVAALIDVSDAALSREEVRRLRQLIEQYRDRR